MQLPGSQARGTRPHPCTGDGAVCRGRVRARRQPRLARSPPYRAGLRGRHDPRRDRGAGEARVRIASGLRHRHRSHTRVRPARRGRDRGRARDHAAAGGANVTLPLATLLTASEGRSLVVVFLATFLGAVFSRLHSRIVLPTVVVEIVLGIVIGPQVLDIAHVNAYITFLSNMGLALLFFFAGLEVIEKKVPRQAVVRGTLGWTISLAIGLAVGLLLQQAGLDAR